MESQDFIVDVQGNFRFTRPGIENQAPLLAMAGIDASAIKTYEDYLAAREAAGPYFMEYLQLEMDKRLESKPDTLEWQAIRSIAFGAPEEQIKLLKKLKRKRSVTGNPKMY